MSPQESATLPSTEELPPLNAQQKVFARELGVAMARGDRDFTKAYEAAGYAAHRGNAARLAANPLVKAIAEQACAEALRLAGLHIGYLQAKALELLQASATKIHRTLSKAMTVEVEMTDKGPIMHPRLRSNLTLKEQAEIDAATWALSEFKIDDKGVITVKLPDKKALIEMLTKQLGVGTDNNSTTVQVTLERLVAASMQTPQKQGAQ